MDGGVHDPTRWYQQKLGGFLTFVRKTEGSSVLPDLNADVWSWAAKESDKARAAGAPNGQ